MKQITEQEEMALFRYAIIAPMVCRDLKNRQERRLLKEEILAKQYRHPGGNIVCISERTIRYWIARYREHGIKGLYDGLNRPRKNKGVCKALSKEVLEVAEFLRREVTSRTVEQILALLPSEFIKRGLGKIDTKEISSRTLSRFFRNKGLTRTRLERGEGYFQRRECTRSNEMWQGDTSSGIWLPDPHSPGKFRRSKLIAFIDDASRVITHAEFYFDEKMPSLVDAFTKALLKRGKPHQLLLDNGSNYRSHLMEGICAQLQIELSFCKPRRPQGKGKIERWFRTAKDEFYEEAGRAGIQSLEELNDRLRAWMEQVYHSRKHSELGQSPIQRWEQDEQLIRVLVPDEVRRALMIRQRRKVHENTSTVALDNEEYQVSPSYAGENVELRWHPDLIDQVEIWHDGTFVEIAERITRPAHVERQKPLEEEKTYEPLSSSKAFMQSLVEKNFGDQIMAKPRKDLLSCDEFVELIIVSVQRSLKEKEIDSLRIFFRCFAPLARDVVENAVQQAIDAKGGGLHVRYLVQHLEQKIQAGR